MKQNHLVVGILAHVDAGKTTLAESILYECGNIRKLGRVDHRDAFLDHFELERTRGITIFSKQAEIALSEKQITLLDTPGHVDFSAEMERTLQVLDYAVLVISATDGVQGHVKTLWALLKRYEIPVFLFVNKMDRPDVNGEEVLNELRSRLDENCIDFSQGVESDACQETIAMCDEALLERYLDGQVLSKEDIQSCIQKRKIYPCFFGSALKMQGIDTFMEGLDLYTKCSDYPDEFGAKIYKISRDKQGNRLTHLKITGGSLKAKSVVVDEQKVDQIRIYSGVGFETVNEVYAGSICAVTGLRNTKAGTGLGIEKQSLSPMLAPILTYQILLPDDADVHSMFVKLKQLEEEEPELHIVWNEQLNEIHAQVMG